MQTENGKLYGVQVAPCHVLVTVIAQRAARDSGALMVNVSIVFEHPVLRFLTNINKFYVTQCGLHRLE
jgi:hypothetical protein